MLAENIEGVMSDIVAEINKNILSAVTKDWDK